MPPVAVQGGLHKVADKHVVENLVFDTGHQRIARRLEGHAPLVFTAVEGNVVVAASHPEGDKIQEIEKMGDRAEVAVEPCVVLRR